MIAFRGQETARIDDKGRLKIPAKFKRVLEAAKAETLFATAVTDEAISLYPLSAWEAIESKVRNLGMLHPRRRVFDRRVHYFGSEVTMDKQGRVLLKSVQRELLNHQDEVVLLGCMDHLEMYSAASLRDDLKPAELTEQDLGELGI